jgi:hypothetical protein
MKPTMLFAIVMLSAIVLMTAFNFTLTPVATETAARVAGPEILYVCPAESSVWDTLANALGYFTRPIVIAFCFAVILLLFTWGWALYQNLLKDKFVRDAFKTPWAFTKMLFWGAVAIFILIRTPDSFRIVHIDGATGDWVLCDNNTPGARAVHADKVHL